MLRAKLPGLASIAHRVQEDPHVAAAAEHDHVTVAPQAGRVGHPEGGTRGRLAGLHERSSAQTNKPGLVLVWVLHLEPRLLPGVQMPGVTCQKRIGIFTFSAFLNSVFNSDYK